MSDGRREERREDQVLDLTRRCGRGLATFSEGAIEMTMGLGCSTMDSSQPIKGMEPWRSKLGRKGTGSSFEVSGKKERV